VLCVCDMISVPLNAFPFHQLDYLAEHEIAASVSTCNGAGIEIYPAPSDSRRLPAANCRRRCTLSWPAEYTGS